MPTCTKCKETKPQFLFYTGVPRCKACHKKAVHENYIEKLKDPVWREKELDRQRSKAQRARERGQYPSREAQRKGALAWTKRNPEKKSATSAVNNAIRSGKLKRQPCEVCGYTLVQAHHDDYTKPLSVRWLCHEHHAAHHVEMRRRERFIADALTIHEESQVAMGV